MDREKHEKGEPLGLQYRRLGAQMAGKWGPEYVALKEQQAALFEVMAERNDAARKLEKQGKISKALELYEMNVADWFHGSLPYDRLRIIYTRQKRSQDALRVCDAFFRQAPLNPNVLKPAHGAFVRHRDRLREKMEKEGS